MRRQYGNTQSTALEPAESPLSVSGARLIKNTSVLMVSQLFTWGLTLLLTLFLPRYLGPSSMGLLAITISFWSLLQVFIGFGMDTHVVKQIARDPEQAYTLLGTTCLARVLLYLLCLLPVSIGLWVMQMPLSQIIVVQLVGVSFLINALASGTQSILQGLEIMEYISISNIASRAVNSLLGIGVLLAGFGLFAIAIVLVVAALVLLLANLFFLQRHRPLRLSFEGTEVLPMLRSSLPYMATALVMVGYAQLNILIIGLLMSSTEAGWYGAAMQLFTTLLFLPVAFGTALLPQMTRFHRSDEQALAGMLRKSVQLVLLVGVPIGLGLVAVAGSVVELIFGSEYGPSSSVLQVLGVTLIFMYLNVLIGQFFTATDRQNVWTVTIAVSVVLMAGMTVLLVTLCQQYLGNGALGGAFSLLCSEATMALIGVVLLRGKLLSRALIWNVARILIAGGVMLAAVWFLRDAMLLLPIVTGMLVYPSMVLLLRILPREDFVVLQTFMGSIVGRLHQPQLRRP